MKEPKKVFFYEMTSWLPSWKYDITSEFQLVHNYLKDNPAKRYPHPIWNNKALGFSEEHHPSKKKNNNKMSGNGNGISSWSKNVTDTEFVVLSWNDF